MNREEFLRQLEQQLMSIPEGDRLDAIAYYNDYFDEAGYGNEQDVIRELGSPDKVARTIIDDWKESNSARSRDYSAPEEEERTSYEYHGDYENQDRYGEQRNYQNQYDSYKYNPEAEKEKKRNRVLLIVIAILTFPLWIGIVAGLFGGVIGLCGGLIGVICGLFGAAIGLIGGGVGLIVGGFAVVVVNQMEALVLIGAGAILAAVGLLILLLCIWLVGVWIPSLVRIIVKGVRGLFRKDKGGNEI